MPTHCAAPRTGRAQRGAALLLAMLIVTLVATLAAGMVWQQWRAIEVESAERARTQSAWLLGGALDWARLILREDARDGGPDGLTEPWATGLAEIRLSTFLAADANRTDETGLDAFLSGQIRDAQARYNLTNLISDDEANARAEVAILARLCDALGLPTALAGQIAEALRAAQAAEEAAGDGNAQAAAGPDAVLRPRQVAQLAWLGLDAESLRRLAPHLVILPQHTPVNINTAAPEVLLAVVEGLDRGSAQRLVQQRAQLRKGFEQLAEAQKLLPASAKLLPRHTGTTSNHFEVSGQLRYENHVLRERSLVQRRGTEVRVLQRERLAHDASPFPE